MATVEAPLREEVTSPNVDELNQIWEAPTHQRDEVWQLVLMDDPVNTQDFVVRILMDYFGMDKNKAVRKMYEVHYQGQSIVADGSHEEILVHHEAMGSYKLTSRVEKV